MKYIVGTLAESKTVNTKTGKKDRKHITETIEAVSAYKAKDDFKMHIAEQGFQMHMNCKLNCFSENLTLTSEEEFKARFQNFQEFCYEAYIMDWIRTHVTIPELRFSIHTWMLKQRDVRTENIQPFEEYIRAYGFGGYDAYTGPIFDSKEDFLQNEFTDRKYMIRILSDEEADEYKLLTGVNV